MQVNGFELSVTSSRSRSEDMASFAVHYYFWYALCHSQLVPWVIMHCDWCRRRTNTGILPSMELLCCNPLKNVVLFPLKQSFYFLMYLSNKTIKHTRTFDILFKLYSVLLLLREIMQREIWQESYLLGDFFVSLNKKKWGEGLSPPLSEIYTPSWKWECARSKLFCFYQFLWWFPLKFHLFNLMEC